MAVVAPKRRLALALALVPVCSAVLVFTYANLRHAPPADVMTLREMPAVVPAAAPIRAPSSIQEDTTALTRAPSRWPETMALLSTTR